MRDKIRTGGRSDRPNTRVSMGTAVSKRQAPLWRVATAPGSDFIELILLTCYQSSDRELETPAPVARCDCKPAENCYIFALQTIPIRRFVTGCL